MIRTKSIFQLCSPSDGTRILITYRVSAVLRKLPFDSHRDELGPSKNLLDDWKGKKISWWEYEKRFLEEMDSPRSKAAIDELALRSLRGATITLLCYEKEENPHCHRHIVKELISKAAQALLVEGWHE